MYPVSLLFPGPQKRFLLLACWYLVAHLVGYMFEVNKFINRRGYQEVQVIGIELFPRDSQNYITAVHQGREEDNCPFGFQAVFLRHYILNPLYVPDEFIQV